MLQPNILEADFQACVGEALENLCVENVYLFCLWVGLTVYAWILRVVRAILFADTCSHVLRSFSLCLNKIIFHNILERIILVQRRSFGLKFANRFLFKFLHFTGFFSNFRPLFGFGNFCSWLRYHALFLLSIYSLRALKWLVSSVERRSIKTHLLYQIFVFKSRINVILIWFFEWRLW